MFTSTLGPRPSSHAPLYRSRPPRVAIRALRPGCWLVNDGPLNYTPPIDIRSSAIFSVPAASRTRPQRAIPASSASLASSCTSPRVQSGSDQPDSEPAALPSPQCALQSPHARALGLGPVVFAARVLEAYPPWLQRRHLQHCQGHR